MTIDKLPHSMLDFARQREEDQSPQAQNRFKALIGETGQLGGSVTGTPTGQPPVYAAQKRRGTPHPRHWVALEELATLFPGT
jgi:hypothetical protein